MFKKLKQVKEPSKCKHGVILDLETKTIGKTKVLIKDPKKCKDCVKAQKKLIKKGSDNGE